MQRDLTGAIHRWIDVGLPDEKSLRKASGRAERVIVYAYGGRAVDLWWTKNRDALERLPNFSAFAVPPDASQALARLAQRTMQLNARCRTATSGSSNATETVAVECTRPHATTGIIAPRGNWPVPLPLSVPTYPFPLSPATGVLFPGSRPILFRKQSCPFPSSACPRRLCVPSPNTAIPNPRRSRRRRFPPCSRAATCWPARRPAPARPPASRCRCCSGLPRRRAQRASGPRPSAR